MLIPTVHVASSEEYSFYGVANAFESSSDYWRSADEVNSWVQISFANAVSVSSYQLLKMTSRKSDRTRNFTFQGSNAASPATGKDAADWTTLDVQENAMEDENKDYTFILHETGSGGYVLARPSTYVLLMQSWRPFSFAYLRPLIRPLATFAV
jgi:hypothetical protein